MLIKPMSDNSSALDGRYDPQLFQRVMAGWIGCDHLHGRPIDAFGNDVSDQRVIQNTPDWTANGRVSYDTPFAGGNLLLNTQLSYRGDSSQFEVPNAYLDQEAFTLWDASVRWETADGRWGFQLTGKNLTDEEYIVAGYNFVTVNNNGTVTPTLGLEGTLTAFYGDPRTVTAGIDYKF